MSLTAVLFDLGSTLWDDYPAELFYWELLSSMLAGRGIEATLDGIMEQSRRVIASYSPSLTRAIVWHYVGGDRTLYDEIMDGLVKEILGRFQDPAEFRRLNPLFPGVHELLEQMARRYPLAVVSQNFTDAERWLGYHGLTGYFQHVTLSHRERLFKPDPRLFLTACDALGVKPAEAMMVGDRLDNDIWPANRLRMTTVRVLSEPYRIQQPRYHADVPDYTVERIAELSRIAPLQPG